MDDLIKHMVDRFLTWRLPDDFSPDAGISFKAEFNENTAQPMKQEPVGTNLLDAAQAAEMVRHMLTPTPGYALVKMEDAEAAEKMILGEAVNDELVRLRNIEEKYNAGIKHWNGVFKVVLDERDALRDRVKELEAGDD